MDCSLVGLLQKLFRPYTDEGMTVPLKVIPTLHTL